MGPLAYGPVAFTLTYRVPAGDPAALDVVLALRGPRAAQWTASNPADGAQITTTQADANGLATLTWRGTWERIVEISATHESTAAST